MKSSDTTCNSGDARTGLRLLSLCRGAEPNLDEIKGILAKNSDAICFIHRTNLNSRGNRNRHSVNFDSDGDHDGDGHHYGDWGNIYRANFDHDGDDGVDDDDDDDD
eukprot:CAMPEP_0197245190 /NCGR_PEP_ID=MMETSP1429-20130617/10057_1 /TAXON_ID=49237 /ORGANISM="Chaetoceros  sp., Strain UNC1202" /LENGTH=105 /DNA_ID=CAMNT_0042705641 /DNA_START=34 /DNA_END=348 /DNA_ORIENTATION=+